MRACMRACVRVCMRACGRAGARTRVPACLRSHSCHVSQHEHAWPHILLTSTAVFSPPAFAAHLHIRQAPHVLLQMLWIRGSLSFLTTHARMHACTHVSTHARTHACMHVCMRAAHLAAKISIFFQISWIGIDFPFFKVPTPFALRVCCARGSPCARPSSSPCACSQESVDCSFANLWKTSLVAASHWPDLK